MKKIFTFALVATLAFATACNGDNNEEQFNRLVTPYSSAEMDQILVTDVQKILTVDVSENEYLRNLLETVEYYESNQSQADVSPSQVGFVITLDTMEIQVYTPSLVQFVYEDNTTEFACVENSEFSYVNSVIASEVLSFDNYTVEQTVIIKNASNATAEDLDKEWFLDELGSLFFVKLSNAKDYDLGSWAYNVNVGSDTMIVYQNYVTVNGSLYRLHEGSFDFFYELDFGTSSGWLPWL